MEAVFHFFNVRSKGAILARLLKPTRYGTLLLVIGEAVVDAVDFSGVPEAAAGDGFDGRLDCVVVSERTGSTAPVGSAFSGAVSESDSN